MTDLHDIIARCTRGDVTSWQQVAKQLGRSVDSVRAQYDPTYLRAHCWAPSRERDPELEPPVDENDMRSPHAKGPGLRVEVLQLLSRHSVSAATIAAMVSTTVGCAKWQMSILKREGLVSHTDLIPYTWTLTEAGRRVVAELCQPNAFVEGEVA